MSITIFYISLLEQRVGYTRPTCLVSSSCCWSDCADWLL